MWLVVIAVWSACGTPAPEPVALPRPVAPVLAEEPEHGSGSTGLLDLEALHDWQREQMEEHMGEITQPDDSDTGGDTSGMGDSDGDSDGDGDTGGGDAD